MHLIDKLFVGFNAPIEIKLINRIDDRGRRILSNLLMRMYLIRCTLIHYRKQTPRLNFAHVCVTQTDIVNYFQSYCGVYSDNKRKPPPAIAKDAYVCFCKLSVRSDVDRSLIIGAERTQFERLDCCRVLRPPTTRTSCWTPHSAVCYDSISITASLMCSIRKEINNQ